MATGRPHKPVLLDSALRRQLEVPAVLGHLIYFCLNLYDSTAADIERHWGVPFTEAYSLGIRSVPGRTGNIIAAHECVKRFGPRIVSRVDGFYPYRRSGPCECSDWGDSCFCERKIWRIDLDERLYGSGIILPQRGKHGFASIKVFRHARDSRPFPLKVRREIAA